MTALANRFSNPFPQFQDAAGVARDGGTLGFYLTGTNTVSPAYTDSTHTIPAGTAGIVTLNALGASPTDLFLDPAITYRVQLKDAAGNVVWTADPYYDPLLQQQAKFAVYAGDPNLNVAGTAGTPGGTPADVIFDTSNLIIWVCTTTGNAAAAVWTSTTGQISGAVTFTGVISPTAISTNQNDYSPTGLASASEIRLNVSGDCLLTGLAGGAAGRIVTLVNIGTNRVTLMNLSASSTSANSFRIGGNLFLDPDDQITLKYDAVSGRWRVWSVPLYQTPPICQGRLTLTSGQPVMTAGYGSGESNAAASLIYLTPTSYGNYISIYDGGMFQVLPFTEQTLTLNANHTTLTLYDIFAYVTSTGQVAIATGPSWAAGGVAGAVGPYVSAGVLSAITVGARGTGASSTALTRIGGVLVNAVDMVARNGALTPTILANKGLYLGSIWVDVAAGAVSCMMLYGQNRKWGLWNAFNRSRITMLAGSATANWAYNTAGIRASNAATDVSANSITALIGLAEESVEARFQQFEQNATNSQTPVMGIGIGSITAFSGTQGSIQHTAAALGAMMVAEAVQGPLFGLQSYSCLEKGGGAATNTWLGTQANMQLRASYMG